MELKIITSDETDGQKPSTKSEDDFPLNTSWMEETSTHLKQAYEITCKGDGELAYQVADLIQSALDILKPETESEEVEAMSKTKTDYMDKFIKDEEEESESPPSAKNWWKPVPFLVGGKCWG